MAWKFVQNIRLSPIVRLRMLLRDEVDLLFDNQPKYSIQEHLKGLIEQKRVVEKNRDAVIKSLVVTLLFIYLISNGVSIKIPSLASATFDIPNVQTFLVPYAAFSFFMLIWHFTNDQVYRALIDQVVNKASMDGIIDPDIVIAAFDTQELSIKLFRDRSNIYFEESLRPDCGAKFLNRFVMGLFSLGFLSIVIGILFFLAQEILKFIGGTYLQIAALIFSCAFLLLSVVIIVFQSVPLSYKQYEFEQNDDKVKALPQKQP